MGLLSDPDVGSVKWVRVLKKLHGPLCFLCYVGALVWFVMLGNKEFNNETYFSENALLPGLVTNEFNGENSAKQFFNELLLEMEVNIIFCKAFISSGRCEQMWLVMVAFNKPKSFYGPSFHNVRSLQILTKSNS